MSLLNCEIHQRGRVSWVVDTELVLYWSHNSFDHQVQFLASIPGVGWVRPNQTNKACWKKMDSVSAHFSTTFRFPHGKNQHLLSGQATPQIIRNQLRAPLKPLNMIVLWCTWEFWGPSIGSSWCRETTVSRDTWGHN